MSNLKAGTPGEDAGTPGTCISFSLMRYLNCAAGDVGECLLSKPGLRWTAPQLACSPYIASTGTCTHVRPRMWEPVGRPGHSSGLRYEIWEYCQSTVRVQARVLQNLRVGCGFMQVAGILGGDPVLIGQALDSDIIVEAARGPLIPGFAAVKAAAKAAGGPLLWLAESHQRKAGLLMS